jgi:glycosyltransferase involved in cell wall biosynthesis
MTETSHMDVPRPSPSVAVVVPVYNRLNHLATTLESVLSQTYRDLILLVVDDGSQEDVPGFVSGYPDSRLRLLRQTNQGNAAARNAGVRQSAGQLVACLDSDDVWHPDFLRTCIEYLVTHPLVDVVFSQVRFINAEDRPLPQPVGPEPHSGDLLEPLLMGYPILPSSTLVRRVCFDRWGAYEPGFDDWELWLRWAAGGCRFHCIDRPLVSYRIHDHNLHLEWESRRSAHVAMLDHFYSRCELPERAKTMRDAAYAEQYVQFAVRAWQAGRISDAVSDFLQAVRVNPRLLEDLDFYFRIACAHQDQMDYGSSRNLSLDKAQTSVRTVLDAAFKQPGGAVTKVGRRGPASARAYLALSRLAFGVPEDMPAARRFLHKAFAEWPPVVWHTDWALWLGRVWTWRFRQHSGSRQMRAP